MGTELALLRRMGRFDGIRLHCSLLLLLLLLAAPAAAQTPFTARAIYPLSAATEVPTNSSVRVQFRGALFIMPEGGIDDALIVRGEEGELIVPAFVDAQALDFVEGGVVRAVSPGGYRGPTPDKGFELWTEPLALRANAHYEIRSRLATCAEGETLLVCEGSEYRTIAEFTTGSELDLGAPTATWDGSLMPGSSACESLVSLEAVDDAVPRDAIRFVQEVGEARLLSELGSGPVVALTASGVEPADGTELATVNVRALDPSGNLSDPIAVQLPSCSGFDLSVLGCDTGPPGCPARPSDAVAPNGSSGCSVGALPSRTTSGAAFLGLAASALLVVARAARKRRV